ncbi:MAG TPA: patatin-like phospholipase family protein [Pyrinomonadaceae bacterium]|nr:patatin-like phospholipase family protein [Pyrinomonadaceae bacterium]
MPTAKFKTYHCVLDWFKAFFRVAFAIRFSIAMSLLAGVAVSLPAQALEALRVLASRDEGGWQTWPRVLFVVSALLLSLLSWYCARVLLYLIDPLPDSKGCAEDAKKFWVRHLPRIAGALPLLFIAVALFSAADSNTVEGRQRAGTLKGAALASLLLAFFLYSFFHLRRRLAAWLKGRKAKAEGKILPPVEELARRSRIVFVAALLVYGSLLFFFTVEWGRRTAVEAAITFGPLALVLLFAALWVPVGSALVYASHRTRLPLFLILLILALTFSAFDWNDNHAVRHRRIEGQAKPTDVDAGFKGWLKNRCDRDAYKAKGQPYPVFIVSAEGGGLRAGYFASLVLSKLQDENPAFAHHVFAISGVSGGSLGGAVFAAMAQKYVRHDNVSPCNFRVEGLPDIARNKKTGRPDLRTLNDEVLGHDVLSPILASLLYPDLVQRFLPFPVERFDRGRAAEDALSYYWRRATGGDEFTKNYLLSDLYKSGFETGSTPALFLNTTRVETGEQLVVSNLNPEGPDQQRNRRLNGLNSLADLDSTLSVPLVSAAYMSSRFPIVAPAGYLEPGGNKVRFVDGGYFENSGTATLLDLLSALKINEAANEAATDVQIIVIRIGSNPPELDARPCPNETAAAEQDERCGQAELQYRWHGLGEITSPIFAVVNAGVARGNLSVLELRTAREQLSEQGQAAAGQSEPQVTQRIEAPASGATSKLRSVGEAHFSVVETKDIKLPLGFLLSAEAREEMDRQVGVGENRASFDGVLGALKAGQ